MGERGPLGTLRAGAWEYLEELRVLQRTPAAVMHRWKSLKHFFAWCGDRGLSRPEEVTQTILERYQRHLFYARKRNGKPLSARTQYAALSSVKLLFRWLTRKKYLGANPASELLLPRLPQRLPQAVLSLEEAEGILAQPDISRPEELRDRAILEVFYSTGLRRAEVAALGLFDVDAGRGTIWVRQGKGRKDRVVPIGERALAWVLKYVEEARPQLALSKDEGQLFLGDAGEGLHPDYLSQLVRWYLKKAGFTKPGACHLFRHSMATAMLDGGADVRFVQEMLGHVSLVTTQVYTRVSVEKLKAVHAATHPAARLLRSGAPLGEQPVAELEPAPVLSREELLEQLASEAEEEETPRA